MGDIVIEEIPRQKAARIGLEKFNLYALLFKNSCLLLIINSFSSKSPGLKK